jgi:hypothetical protein
MTTHPVVRHAALAALGLLVAGTAHGATLKPETVHAWDRYVAATEARLEAEQAAAGRGICQFAGPAERARLMQGEALTLEARDDEDDQRVPGGLIHHWRGCILLPGAALDPLLDALQHPPEHGPFQEDVVAMRVVSRRTDGLRLFIRMQRRQLVTVTYDTLHDVTYRRPSASVALSRSVSTRIAEVEDAGRPGEHERPIGDDHGFLWRMNAYWRYTQVPEGVIVEVESLTLSRRVPFGFRTIVRPLVVGVARESLERTLVSLRDLYARES